MVWKEKLFPPPAPVSLYEADYFLPDLCRGEGLLAIIVITELLALLLVLAQSGLVGFDWLALGNVSMMAMWISLSSALVLCKCNRWLLGVSYVYSALLSYGVVLSIAFAVGVAAEWMMVVYGFGHVFDITLPLETVLITAIPAGILLRYLFIQQQLRVQQRAELQSRIEALQSRIRPHFLFNSMNMIASLIGSDAEKAERVVEDLADLFRRALSDSHTLIPLREELALCRSYMSIEQMRLGDRLEVKWEVGDYGLGVQIPCLSLQPILENAVYHGIQLLPEGGQVEVKVKRVKERVNITVKNPINPRIRHNKGSKMSMDNVRSRLEAHFGPTATVKSRSTNDHYITTLDYPQIW